jgi:hypothetical protein
MFPHFSAIMTVIELISYREGPAIKALDLAAGFFNRVGCMIPATEKKLRFGGSRLGGS